MDNPNFKKNTKKGNGKPNNSKNLKKQGKPQRSEKAKKGGRQGKTAITGFSTLSQVAGVPLRRSFHSSLEIPMPKVVNEPYPICSICGERIDLIADSFFVGGEYVHFECMLERIKESEVLSDNQNISYLGSGSFGVCQKDENGKYTIIKRIEVENKDEALAIRNYIEGLKV